MGGGGTHSYKSCNYVPLQRVSFLRRFGMKRPKSPFWSRIELDGFRRNHGSVISIPDESDRKNNMRFRNGFQKSFCWRSYLNDDEIISTYARSENGYRF